MSVTPAFNQFHSHQATLRSSRFLGFNSNFFHLCSKQLWNHCVVTFRMVLMTRAIVAYLRRAINWGSILVAYPHTWKAEELYPGIILPSSKSTGTMRRLNCALFFCYTAYLGFELWQFVACKQNLVALISIAFLFLFYAFGSVFQLAVINGEEEIVGFIRKCMHMNPKAEPNCNAKAPQLILLCEKIMAVTFYGAIMNAVDKWVIPITTVRNCSCELSCCIK